jgi:hypothetical protein
VAAPRLAQLNIARALAPLESPQLAGFAAALDEVNALADAAPGFLWRLQGDDDLPGATGIRITDDPLTIVNLSLWESRRALWDFVYSGRHLEVMRRRREWFTSMATSHMVLWWINGERVPAVEDALERLRRLHADGPGPGAFTFKHAFEHDGAPVPA